MTRCKAVIATQPNRCVLGEVTLPDLEDGQVLSQTLYSVVSPGTERRRISGAAGDRFPFVPGYASCVRVVESRGVMGVKPGDLMVPATKNAVADTNSCWGGHCAMQVTPGDRLLPVPGGLDPKAAAACKLASIAHHGVVRAGLQPSDRVLVIGLGLLGQLVARIAASRCQLEAADVSDSAVARAKAAGLRAEAVDSSLEPAASRLTAGLDVILDVTGVTSVPGVAMSMLRDLPWGVTDQPMPRYVIQGSYAGDITLPYVTAFMKEATIILPRDNGLEDGRTVLSMLADGSLVIDDLLDDVRPAEQAAEIFDAVCGGTLDGATVVLDWQG